MPTAEPLPGTLATALGETITVTKRRRGAAGETVEVTDRGRPVAVLLKMMPSGLARLERDGFLRRAEADLLDLRPVRLPADAKAPSQVVSEGRAD